MHDPPLRPASDVPSLALRLDRARRKTLALVDLVEEPDQNRSLDPEFSPLRWHLGHVAAFEAWWVHVQAGERDTLDSRYDRLFDPTRNRKEDRVHLPDRAAILDYADRVRSITLAVLSGAAPDHPSPLLRDGYVGELVYEHECQHQEILTFLLQMLPISRKRRPDGWKPAIPGVEPSPDFVEISGGPFRMGWEGPGFGYDNEKPAHIVEMPPYRMARAPVTELAFLSFLEAGGYGDPSLWTEEGWNWRAKRGAEAPRDWERAEGGDWTIRTMFEVRSPLAGHPVVGVSQFEALAFARWAGLRLPAEPEWERAASWHELDQSKRRFPWGDESRDSERANLDADAWGTRPIGRAGRSAAGCDDMAGQVWEWTASDFAPYPGFRPFPYEGYSQAWFDGEHRVLRGGSWATSAAMARCTFRNWYHPFVRAIFAGFRCARDA